MTKQRPYAILAILLLHFAVFFVFKIIRFDALSYASNDMTMNVESAFSWLNGRPFSYNNVLGRLDHDHNYWILGALSHICYYWGAYGVFFVQLFLTFLALVWANRVLDEHKIARSWQLLLWLCFVASPTYLWLIDHPNTGWVIEFLVFPACLFFVLGLVSNKNWAFWLSAIFLMSIREESAILGFYLHTSYWIYRYEQQGISFAKILQKRKLWTAALGWGAMFVASVLYLIWLNQGKGTMGNSLSNVGEIIWQSSFYERIAPLFFKALGLIVPTWILALLITTKNKKISISSIIFLLYAFSFLILTVIQNTRYLNYTDPIWFETVGMTWAPRVFYGYSFVAAYALMIVILRPTLPTLTKQFWAIVLIILLAQFPITQYCRSVDVNYLTMLKTVIKRRPIDKIEHLVRPNDLLAIRKIANDIPDKSDVFAFDYTTSIFHKHHLLWLTNKEFEKADIAILPKNDFLHLKNDFLPKLMKTPYETIEMGLEGYDVYATAEYKKYLGK